MSFQPSAVPNPSWIHYSSSQNSLGQLLLAYSPRGVCHLSMGDQLPLLEAQLLHKHPQAQRLDAEPELQKLLEQANAFIETPSTHLDLPLDLRGTPFQLQVWQALQAIPIGTTTTYAVIAHRLEAPQAVRAVASACAANPVALGIPCHRVISSHGSLSGYRWGIERKAELLRRESALLL